MDTLIEAMTGMGDDLYGHVHRVAGFATSIGRALSLDKDDVDRLHVVGVLHDIGKIHVDPAILAKRGPLQGDELVRMRLHPELGFAMTVGTLDRSIAAAILHHHERWDGGGYPFGLVGEQIPRLARIVLVADAFDAITSHRSYQPALPVEHALDEIRRNAGSQFDPEVARVFVELVESGWLSVTPTRIVGVAAR